MTDQQMSTVDRVHAWYGPGGRVKLLAWLNAFNAGEFKLIESVLTRRNLI